MDIAKRLCLILALLAGVCTTAAAQTTEPPAAPANPLSDLFRRIDKKLKQQPAAPQTPRNNEQKAEPSDKPAADAQQPTRPTTPPPSSAQPEAKPPAQPTPPDAKPQEPPRSAKPAESGTQPASPVPQPPAPPKPPSDSTKPAEPPKSVPPAPPKTPSVPKPPAAGEKPVKVPAPPQPPAQTEKPAAKPVQPAESGAKPSPAVPRPPAPPKPPSDSPKPAEPPKSVPQAPPKTPGVPKPPATAPSQTEATPKTPSATAPDRPEGATESAPPVPPAGDDTTEPERGAAQSAAGPSQAVPPGSTAACGPCGVTLDALPHPCFGAPIYVFRSKPCKPFGSRKTRVFSYYPGWPAEARILGRPSGCLIPSPPFIRYRSPAHTAPPPAVPQSSPQVEPPPAPQEEPPPAPSTEARHRSPSRPSSFAGRFEHPERHDAGLRRPARLLLTGQARHDAGLHYTAGFNAYWQGDYRSAVVHLRTATRLVPDDARFQMYHGLALLASGDELAGERAIRAAWSQSAGQLEALYRAIERVQGPLRQRIEALRHKAPEPAAPAAPIARR